MPLAGAPIPVLLQQRAELQPDGAAYTFIDYDENPDGFAETLTWSQVLHRSRALAEELTPWGSPGDRAAILAPQGLDYIVAFFGAIQAGFIAVPLSVPQYGVHDERVASALHDSQPAVILTTSAAVGNVNKYASGQAGEPTPAVLELDQLDLDAPRHLSAVARFSSSEDDPAYLQYTSGSTRSPAGVIITHKNFTANLQGTMTSFFGEPGTSTPGIKWVSWLPYYHDLGLMFGIGGPMLDGRHGVSLSPQSFLFRPARWMQLLARSGQCWSGGPNFAFDLAARKTTDEHMTGLDLGNVVALSNGGERIHVPTAQRFLERFARFNLSPNAVTPSYGLAESTLYVATPRIGLPPNIVRFDSEQLVAGQATPCADDDAVATELIGYGPPNPATVRIVCPRGKTECEPGVVGEIWTHGDSVGLGYWRNPEQTERTFGAKILDPAPGTPEGPWLRTGDLGVVYDGALFIIGRIKDLLIVDGRNHYPDDIEATVREITGARVATFAAPDDVTERLVAIVELRDQGASPPGAEALRALRREITSAVSKTHALRVADLVLVRPGSIPVTTSGKIRRSRCAELYRGDGFTRLDASARAEAGAQSGISPVR